MKIINLIIIYIAIIHTNYSFLFSVIISIYNTGRYLDDSIGSLINQTIGFQNIQIILVNDGSTDDTENICLNYKKLYDKNIIYVKRAHSGVSKARNAGLKFAEGLYINFLDSDDKWDSNAFKNIDLFYKKYEIIDVVAGRIKNFEMVNEYQFLDYKFKETRVINLTEEFNCIQLSSASCFFRRSAVVNRKFDKEVIFAEDVKFINTILLEKPFLGVVREALYNCRKRFDSTSASQNIAEKKDFYFKSTNLVLQYLIDRSRKLYNDILPFIQFYIAYEILFRIAIKSYKFLDLNSFNNYCKIIENLLNQIEDKYILEVKFFSPIYAIIALSKKYKRDLRNDIILRDETFKYLNYDMIYLNKNRNIIIWRILEMRGNKLHLEGEDKCWMPRENYSYFCQLGNKKFIPNYFNYSGYDFMTMYGVTIKGRILVFDIPVDIEDKQYLHFYISYLDKNIEIFPSLGQFTHIPPLTFSYYVTENFIIRNLNRCLVLYPYRRYLLKKFNDMYNNALKNIGRIGIIKIREDFKKFQKTNYFKEQIWLINDRKSQSGDNGEYFFRYLNQLKPNGIKFFFVIKKDCNDYDKLKKFENIIEYNSSEYLNLFLKAEKIISSVSDSWVINPLGDDSKFLRDLYHFDFIFLNNGIIKDNLSQYLHKIVKNFNLFLTSSIYEYEAIMNYNYGYSKDEIILTGMPRFDNLKQLEKIIKKEKIILIFPTWRLFIKGTLNVFTFESIKSENFVYTNFFNFYNNLINNQQLLDIMEYNNYKGILCLHPNFAEQWREFNPNHIFQVKNNCFDQELLIKSSLLITDYSSIFFDFGYLLKPVIYTQFDIEEYRNKQFPEGYFDYKKHGFGPICNDMQCIINNINDEIENNCIMKEFYLMRVKKFFKFFDDQNCNRTFIEISKKKNNNDNNYKYPVSKGIIQFILILNIIFISIKKIFFKPKLYY